MLSTLFANDVKELKPLTIQ